MMTSLDFTPNPGAASGWQMVRSHTVMELRTTARNGEQLLLTLIIPLGLLVVLTLTPMLDVGSGSRINAITPGILALAVMSTAFTGQAISTGFDRRYGALKLLGSTPLSRPLLVVAKTLAVLVIETVQVALISATAYAIGWTPSGSPVAVLVMLLAGTAAFSALGLALAGLLRAEATLAVANGVYLILLLGGGVVIATDRLPSAWASVASVLPSGALSNGLRSILIDGLALPGQSVAILLLWALAGIALVARTFRWE